MTRKVDIRRFRLAPMVECEQCEDLPPDATRERCRLHAEMREHTVRVVIEDTTVYTKRTAS